MDNKFIRAGAAENIIKVPLFAELSGYGPFLGRRNLGVRDPLYCRVLTVNDGNRRNVIIVSDTISCDEISCRMARMNLASEFALYPESIMFASIHSHTSPSPGNSMGIGYSAGNEEFTATWHRIVRQTLIEAMANEEDVRAFAGKAPVRKELGERRTTDEDKHTDRNIRFVKFVRKDGTVKILLHNYSMHGVTRGRSRFISADWMGNANDKIKKRNLADIPFFMYGCAGDINVIWTHSEAESDKNVDWIGTSYVDDLEAAWNDCEEISLGPCSAVLKTVEFPTEKVDAGECRKIAEALLKKLPSEFGHLLNYLHDRLIEMAVLAERGKDFRVLKDLQVLKMGDFEVYAAPGEAFLDVGEKLMENSDAKFPIAVSVANGHAGYFPVRKMFEKYPDMLCCDDFGAFGFYEVWSGPKSLRAKFQPDIVDFLIGQLIQMGREI